jgi:hypothetical protein
MMDLLVYFFFCFLDVTITILILEFSTTLLKCKLHEGQTQVEDLSKKLLNVFSEVVLLTLFTFLDRFLWKLFFPPYLVPFVE